MIYKFHIISSEPRSLRCEIEADASHTFLDIHRRLQETLRISTCQLAAFFVYNASDRKLIEISEVEMGPESWSRRCMRRTRIGDSVTAAAPFIRYTYDLYNDHSFIMELTGINMEKNLREPLVRVNGNESHVEVLEAYAAAEPAPVPENGITSDYGMLDDYYEVFGDIEELTL